MKKGSLAISFILIAALVLSACSAIDQASNSVAKALAPQATALAATAMAQNNSQNSPGSQAQPTNTNPQAVQGTQAPLVTIAPQPTAPLANTGLPNTGGNPGLLGAYEGTLENVYNQVNPQVVNIQVIEQSSGSGALPSNPFFGSPNGSQGQPAEALGSGFVWDNQGNIVTNNHVVAGASIVNVTFADGATFPAKIAGTDPYSDLAVVNVSNAGSELKPVTLADSRQVRVGQLAIAIGNPFGLQGTMTVGIISALGRSLPATTDPQQSQTPVTGPTYSIPDVIQTDAAINPGNSGGVLVDQNGHVIGVTAAIESPVQANSGIGFVIPSFLVSKVIPSLIKTGKYDHSYLGISGTTLNLDIAQAMNLNPQQRGALVEEVTPGSPAANAGIQASNQQVTISGQQIPVGGDVIIAIDNHPIQAMDELISYLAENTEVGQKVTLTILRNGKQQDVSVTLGVRPSSTQTANNSGLGQGQSSATGTAYMGITGLPIDTQIAQAMKLPADLQGVLIEQVASGSPASQVKLRAGSKTIDDNGQQISVGGDIILAIDGQQVTSQQDLQGILQQAQPGQQVTVTLYRNGRQIDVPLTLGQR